MQVIRGIISWSSYHDHQYDDYHDHRNDDDHDDNNDDDHHHKYDGENNVDDSYEFDGCGMISVMIMMDWNKMKIKTFLSDIWALDSSNDLHVSIQCHPGKTIWLQSNILSLASLQRQSYLLERQCHSFVETMLLLVQTILLNCKDNAVISIFSQWVKLVLLAGVMSTCLGGVFVGIRWRWIKH